MAEFQIQTTQRDPGGGAQVKVVSVKGDLDAHTFLTLQKELEQTLTAANDPRLVLDCNRLNYISSAGLSVLKNMVRQFRGKGGDIRLACVPAKIDNVIKLLGFNTVLKVFGGIDEAVSSYKPPKTEA